MPDEEGGADQHHCQVDRQGCLEEEGFKESCCVNDAEKENRWQVGCQKLIGQPSFEYDLHF